MARVLILSSLVASSRVGGGAQAQALARLGIEPILAPTVLFGRHPGFGPPGGGPVATEVFESTIGGIEAQGHFRTLDAVIAGYFASAEQVAIAAEALSRVKAANPAARLIVDPIMGDADSGLYVREPTAEAIAVELVPLADIVAPNAWELARLSGQPVDDPVSAVVAAKMLGRPVLVSSIPDGGSIGVLLAGEGEVWLASHARSDAAPKGTGDLLTAIFTAALLGGAKASEALEIAAGVVADAVAEAVGLEELPLAALPMGLAKSSRVTLRRIDG